MRSLEVGRDISNKGLNAPDIADSAYILLRRVFRILRGCGLSASQLKAMTEQALDEVDELPMSQFSRVTARQALTCSDVVLKWRRDCQFLDSTGMPAQLAVDVGSPSFRQLTEVAAPGIDPAQLMLAMEELGVIQLIDGKVELISESVVACSGREGSLVASEFVLEHICGFLGSVEFNVFDKPSRAKGRFERACYASVPKKLVPVLEQLISTRGQDFVDVIDEWLSRRATKAIEDSESVLVGAGAYVFVRNHVRHK